MTILLDTHVLVWLASQPERLSRQTRETIASPENRVLFSAASIWELAIKLQVGRVSLTVSLSDVAVAATTHGFEELPVFSSSAARVRELPLYHRDPFDRLLLAQSLDEGACLFTVDAQLVQYPANVRLL